MSNPFGPIKPRKHASAVDHEGNQLDLNGDEVDAAARHIVEHGEPVMIVARLGDDFGVRVFGPPDIKMLDYLETITKAYRDILGKQ